MNTSTGGPNKIVKFDAQSSRALPSSALLLDSLSSAELIVDLIVASLDDNEDVNERQKSIWVRILKTNKILNAASLATVDQTTLSTLGLPVAAEMELQRLASHLKDGGSPSSTSASTATLSSSQKSESPPTEPARSKNKSHDSLTGSHRGRLNRNVSSGSPHSADLKNSNNATSHSSEDLPDLPLSSSGPHKAAKLPQPFEDASFGLKETEREAVLSTFRMMTQNLELFRKFVRETMDKFKQESSTAKRLFASLSEEDSYRTFLRLVSFLVGFLDVKTAPISMNNFSKLTGRHLIYGATPEDFLCLSDAFVAALPIIFGSIVMNKDVVASWRKLLMKYTEHTVALLEKKEELLVHKQRMFWEQPKGWVWIYAKLTLTTVFFYADEEETKLKAEYPLSHIDAVAFPESPMRWAFDLHSEKLSGLVLNLACKDLECYNEWLDEINWRIAAHHRAFVSFSDPEEDEEYARASRHGSRASGRTRMEKTMKALERKKRSQHKSRHAKSSTGSTEGSTSSSVTENLRKSTDSVKEARRSRDGKDDEPKSSKAEPLPVPVEQPTLNDDAEVVQWSWKTLIEFKDPSLFNVSAVGQFTEDLVNRIAKSQSHMSSLFGKRALIEQRGLARAVDFIARASGGGLDSSLQFADALLGQIETNVAHLGSVHAIYGAEPDDYLVFAECIGNSLEFVLGPQVITSAVKESWRTVVMGVQQLMNNRPSSYDIFKGVLLRQRKKKKWKSVLVAIDLTTLFLYTSEKGDKVKTTHPIEKMTRVEIDHLFDHQSERSSERGVVLMIEDDSELSFSTSALVRDGSSSLRSSKKPAASPMSRSTASSKEERASRSIEEKSTPLSVSTSATTRMTNASQNAPLGGRKTAYFSISSSEAPFRFTFGCTDLKEANKWVHEVRWRIEATRRARGEYSNILNQNEKR